MQTETTDYISPRLAAGAASTRTPDDVLATRISNVRLMPIGRMFLFEVDHKDGSYFTETGALPRGRYLSNRDGLATLEQHDDAVAVWELNPSEGSMRDVSEDFARMRLADLLREGWNPEEDVWPDFVSHHITNDEAMREFSEFIPAMIA